MKFAKFVKSLGTSGVVFRDVKGNRWVALHNVFMRIPENVLSITSTRDVLDMPEEIEDILAPEAVCEAHLNQAIMPRADGSIKDCIRRYVGRHGAHTYALDIDNDAWSLIDAKDICMIALNTYPDDIYGAIALLVGRYPSPVDEDIQIVGMIFPIEEDNE